MSKITEKSDKELEKMLKEKRENLRKFRFNISGSHTKNIREGRMLRREIARILTEISARENASHTKTAIFAKNVNSKKTAS